MIKLFVLLTTICCLLAADKIPLQLHLSYGETPDQMVATWSTAENEETILYYGTTQSGKLDRKATGTSTKFVDGGSKHHTQWIHRVSLHSLTTQTQYSYQVQIEAGQKSKIYTFTTRSSSTSWDPRLMVYGDMGLSKNGCLKYILQEAHKGTFDAVLHNGDFAYNMDSDNGVWGDDFMEMIEPLAANFAYMTSVGNHEHAYNFSHYINRFTMPMDHQNFWYSYDLGPAHILVYSTEVFFWKDQEPLIPTQMSWIKSDLAKANANRKKVPWLITMGHRPFYCSNRDGDDCTKIGSVTRHHLENTFYDAGVDIMIEAHEHSYERTWPVYNEKICNGSTHAPYTNPRAPVHLITGASGWLNNPFKKPPYLPWSALRIEELGVGRMHIINETHIDWKQVSEDGKLQDHITIIQENHGPYHNC